MGSGNPTFLSQTVPVKNSLMVIDQSIRHFGTLPHFLRHYGIRHYGTKPDRDLIKTKSW